LDNDSKESAGFALSTPNIHALQVKLLEMAQANIQLTFEFGARLATIRSPFDFFAIMAEFTSRRIDMLAKNASQMAAFGA
jgi:hypothetical protein